MQPSERRNPLARRQDEEIALAASGDDTITELKYDYGQVDMASRKAVVAAAVEIKTHSQRAKESMIKIGLKLGSVKALLSHGQFGDWCATEFDMSQKTAERMMRAAEVFGSKIDTVSILSDTAMYLLSGPSVPEAAREEIVIEARSIGKSPTKERVQTVIREHSPKPPKPAPAQPAPAAPRPLNLDETIAVIWRLIKHECAGDQRAETLHGIVSKHPKMTDYKHLLTSEVVFSFDTFSKAWSTVANELLGRIEHAKRTAQKAQPAQPRPEGTRVDEDSDEAPPAAPDGLPADLVERGWVLKQMAASGRWWCHNANGPRATSPYDTIAEAATAARGMQVDVAKLAVKPAGDEVTLALRRIEEAVTDLVERLGLDMLRVCLDERQGNPWSLLASKGSNELNWSHGNIVGVSSALVNLGRKGAK